MACLVLPKRAHAMADFQTNQKRFRADGSGSNARVDFNGDGPADTGPGENGVSLFFHDLKRLETLAEIRETGLSGEIEVFVSPFDRGQIAFRKPFIHGFDFNLARGDEVAWFIDPENAGLGANIHGSHGGILEHGSGSLAQFIGGFR
jgi:hypothetical protein